MLYPSTEAALIWDMSHPDIQHQLEILLQPHNMSHLTINKFLIYIHIYCMSQNHFTINSLVMKQCLPLTLPEVHLKYVYTAFAICIHFND